MENPKPRKKIKIGLLARIAIAIVAGIAVGYISPVWWAQLCATFNGVFGQFLGFLIPLIILGFVAPAIAELGGRAGKMLVATAILAYVATMMAGFISYFTGAWLFPDMLAGGGDMEKASLEASVNITTYFNIDIPPMMGVMTALVLAFMLGVGCAVSGSTALLRGLTEFRDIVSLTINEVVLPLLPFYIFGIFVNMTVAGQVTAIITAFAKIIGVIFVMHVGVLLLQYCIAACFNRRNPLKMLWTMMPAYFTALGTQSSAATIPVTLRQTIKMGVDEDVAGFTVPLCATIHMSGSTLKIVACALALLILHGEPYSVGLFAHFIAMIGITIIAAPGIPGGAIMASLGLLSSILSFTDAENALMIALYISMDSFGTACNVTGDGALAVILNRFFGGKVKKSEAAV